MTDTTSAVLPGRPSLPQLKKQAKELLKSFRAGDAGALQEVQQRTGATDPAHFALHDAQTVIARRYGFSSWKQLAAHLAIGTTTDLAAAAREGDVPRIRELLKAHPELVNNEVPGHGEHRAIHYAVLNRHPAAVRALLRGGANPHIGIYPHRDATSARTIARERGYDEIIALMDEHELLQREAMSCPNATVSSTQDDLHRAIVEGRDEDVRGIVEADLSLLKACDRDGANPLHVACGALREDLAAWMLARHNALRKKDLTGRTPLDYAVDAARPDNIAQFLAVSRRLISYGAAVTPRAAVALDDGERLRELYDSDPEHLTGDQRPIQGGLLTLAVRLDRYDMLRLLLDLGLDPDERTRLKDSEEDVYSSGGPLWLAAREGRYEMAELLLERGADPDAMVYASGNPMSCAYTSRDERMKALLASRGARPDVATIGLNLDVEAARTVLQEWDARGGEEPGQGHQRNTVEELLWAAACGGSPQIVEMCLERVSRPLNDRFWFQILEQPLRIWNHGPHRKYRDGERTLYAVCLQRLLEHGVDPNVEGTLGRRILHTVAAFGMVWGQQVMTEEERLSFARLLLDAGASLDVRDTILRSTPLGWAVRWGRQDLVELLLSRGAPANEPDAEPWAAPLAWAQKCGHTVIEAMLRKHGAA